MNAPAPKYETVEVRPCLCPHCGSYFGRISGKPRKQDDLAYIARREMLCDGCGGTWIQVEFGKSWHSIHIEPENWAKTKQVRL
jgi:hypothetical protein